MEIKVTNLKTNEKIYLIFKKENKRNEENNF